MTDIETLKKELNKINCYPPGLEKVSCGIKGEGFFPGARGLWNIGDETISNKPIMILGHDFGAEADYDRSVKRGQENLEALTWKNLQKMLDEFGIKKEACFFTNAIMGVRVSEDINEVDGIKKRKISAIGRSIAYNYENYLNACKRFLIEQIKLQKPKLIIVLGIHVIELVSGLSPQLKDLENKKTYKKIDETNLSSIEGVVFQDIPNYKVTFAFITHPTYRHLNVKRRKLNEEELVTTLLS